MRECDLKLSFSILTKMQAVTLLHSAQRHGKLTVHKQIGEKKCSTFSHVIQCTLVHFFLAKLTQGISDLDREL